MVFLTLFSIESKSLSIISINNSSRENFRFLLSMFKQQQIKTIRDVCLNKNIILLKYNLSVLRVDRQYFSYDFLPSFISLFIYYLYIFLMFCNNTLFVCRFIMRNNNSTTYLLIIKVYF